MFDSSKWANAVSGLDTNALVVEELIIEHIEVLPIHTTQQVKKGKRLSCANVIDELIALDIDTIPDTLAKGDITMY